MAVAPDSFGQDARRTLREDVAGTVRHRLCNDLQMIQSLLRLQVRRSRSGSEARVLEANLRRVRIVALAYELLDFMGTRFLIDMQHFVLQVVAEAGGDASGDPRPTCRVDEGVYLPMRLAVPCALALGELVSNAIEHGRGANVLVQLERILPGYRLVVRDDGPGFDPAMTPPAGAFGLELFRLLVLQLGGEEIVQSAPGKGTEMGVTFPQ